MTRRNGGKTRTLTISVLVSNHNYGRYLEAAIASAQSQSLPPHEIIVVDDGSTDDSRALLARFGDGVRVILQEQRGQAGAMDAAVAVSTGDVLCFLDADDVFLPGKLARVAAIFADERVDWLRHRLAMVDESLRPIGPRVPAILRSGRMPAHPGLIAERIVTAATSGIALRRSLAARVFPLAAQSNGGDVFRLKRDADALLLGRIASAGAVGYNLADVLTLYRQHDAQMYTGPGDVTRALERQIEIADAIAAELAASSERRVRPSQSHKHAMILASMAGARWWSAQRAGAWAEGVRAAGASLWNHPLAAGRQLGALTFAFLAPAAWLRRFHRNQGWSA